MSKPLPIACTLSASALEARGAELRALGGDGLIDFTREPTRAVLRFRPDPGIRERVDAIVAAESQCCAFLDLEVEHRDEATVLTVSAPNGGAETMHELVGALAGR
jgi:hypothetical protein